MKMVSKLSYYGLLTITLRTSVNMIIFIIFLNFSFIKS